MILRRFIAIACIILSSGLSKNIYSAQQGESYAGIQYAMLSYTESGFPDIEPTVLVGHYGYFIYNYIALEGRLGFGLAEDSAKLSSYTFNVDVSYIYGAYITGHYPTSGKLDIYGLAGINMIDLTHTSTATGSTNTTSDAGASYAFGLGMNYHAYNNLGLNLEFARYYSVDEVIIDALSFGFSVRF